MKIFCDTSALAKQYFDEEESLWVKDLLRNSDSLSASFIYLPEIITIINRKKHHSSMTTAKYIALKKLAVKDFATLHIIPFDMKLMFQTTSIVEQFNLRTLDAIHLACAVSFEPDLFVSFDKRQLEIAQKLNLKTVRF